jgi:hypothetical protein
MALHYYLASLINSRFAASQRNHSAIYSTFIQRVLSVCGAPAGVWTTLSQGSTSSFHSSTHFHNGGITFREHSTPICIVKYQRVVLDGWMALRLQWKTVEGGLHLLSGPYLSYLKSRIENFKDTTLFPRVYFCYDSTTRQTTVLTTDLNQSHLCMIHHLRAWYGTSMQPGEIAARLLFQWFAVAQGQFVEISDFWDNDATGTVRNSEPQPQLVLVELTTSSQ